MRGPTLLRSPGVQPSPGSPGTAPGAAPGAGSGDLFRHAPADLVERARRLGPLPHSSLGMYPPAALGAAEVAAWEARTLDRLWEEAGRPDPFTVVQVAAGDGAVAAEMLAGARRPECSPALRLVLVEADAYLRERQAQRLPVESPALLLGPVTATEDPDEDPSPVTGIGPIATALAELPVVRGPSVVVAVGWLSRFSYDLFEWKAGRWHEIRLAAAADSGSDLDAIAVVLDPDRAARLNALVGPEGRAEGDRYAMRPEAAMWLRSAISAAGSGWVVAADTWSDKTSPVGGAATIPVALDQLSEVCHPEAVGEQGPGGLEVARWRIG